MSYPTQAEVTKAFNDEDNSKILNWYNTLPECKTDDENRIMDNITNYIVTNDLLEDEE